MSYVAQPLQGLTLCMAEKIRFQWVKVNVKVAKKVEENRNISVRSLELLAPARTADIGIEAIRHGADAVYIGAPAFGARQAAANSIDDIRRLADYAHLYQAKVYVTVNTIIYEQELKEVEQMIHQLWEAGTDALIVQDMAIAQLDIPPIPLHASTQMDNRSVEKVMQLAELGYEQVVLARELTLDDIRQIHRQCPETRLEAFVHGALCVSYSGRCYVSQALFSRSANRGECAQVCRMAFDLENAKGEKMACAKHLLSLKDLCQLDALQDMAEAGVSSFKIEGRLKDMGYVKNVTAAYSQALDRLVERYPERYRRASKGAVRLRFIPDVEKSFNRGFTHYFLYGNNDDIFSLDTPKSMGKKIGKIKQVFTDSIVVEPEKRKQDGQPLRIHNGDGLCCMSAGGKLLGFRVNRAEGNRLFPLRMIHGLRNGMKVFRNYDKQFEDLLEGESAERQIPVCMILDYKSETKQFELTVADDGREVCIRKDFVPELARTPQADNICRQLSRLGNTPLTMEKLTVRYKENYFIPSSVLAEWRREAVTAFLNREENNENNTRTYPKTTKTDILRTLPDINVANSLARQFYQQLGKEHVKRAYEVLPYDDEALMTCRHCVRYAMGWCRKNPKAEGRSDSGAYRQEPLFLTLDNGIRLRLNFDCGQCLMTVTKP